MLPKIKMYIALELMTTIVVFIWQYTHKGLDEAILTSLTIMIAFSPFCLALTTPLVFKRAKKFVNEIGVKMPSPESLITLSNVDTVAISMSNIITDGNYYVTDLVPEGLSQNGLLAYSASAVSQSDHFLAKKIYEAAEHRGLTIQRVAAFREIPGCGVEALMNNTPVRFGRPKWITSEKVEVSAELLTKVDQLAAKGKTPLMLLMGIMVRGIVALKDEIDLDAKEFLNQLKRRNFETLMLSSESKKTVHAVAKNISVDDVRFALTSEGKAREIQLRRAHGKYVAMIGKDVVDLPAMLSADVSFLLTGKTLKLVDDQIHIDFEIERLEQFFELRKIAKQVKELVTQNKKLAYLSWLLLIPPSLMMMLEHSPIPFNPLLAAIGIFIFIILILVNSNRFKLSSNAF